MLRNVTNAFILKINLRKNQLFSPVFVANLYISPAVGGWFENSPTQPQEEKIALSLVEKPV
ncbi:MAG: hypothetical protein N3E45_04380 [Oscillatoriaceae bacterium SKW80]|nr:hypothetical protein [Oscillatoriaceae bacterium SKYG93]MCX8120055.1 hypothetical protein [Oscillatoriaceae bacterium SKW80]MDW8454059.1 hypothetical protein [Oscillatoriaceae cyanobacterium SKYGB_i_bin93]HIK29703.1 hypothetical protein [Oscillatoriaceae cyanobacterium M7585_C2015_266]